MCGSGLGGDACRRKAKDHDVVWWVAVAVRLKMKMGAGVESAVLWAGPVYTSDAGGEEVSVDLGGCVVLGRAELGCAVVSGCLCWCSVV